MFLIPQDPGREMPRCCFRQVIPPLPLLCSHVLHKRTFIPHFHSTHFACRNIFSRAAQAHFHSTYSIHTHTVHVEISSHVQHKHSFNPHFYSTHSACSNISSRAVQAHFYSTNTQCMQKYLLTCCTTSLLLHTLIPHRAQCMQKSLLMCCTSALLFHTSIPHTTQYMQKYLLTCCTSALLFHTFHTQHSAF